MIIKRVHCLQTLTFSSFACTQMITSPKSCSYNIFTVLVRDKLWKRALHETLNKMSLYFPVAIYDFYLLDPLVGVPVASFRFRQQSVSLFLQDSRPYCLFQSLPTSKTWLAHSFHQVWDVQMAIRYCMSGSVVHHTGKVILSMRVEYPTV